MVHDAAYLEKQQGLADALSPDSRGRPLLDEIASRTPRRAGGR